MANRIRRAAALATLSALVLSGAPVLAQSQSQGMFDRLLDYLRKRMQRITEVAASAGGFEAATPEYIAQVLLKIMSDNPDAVVNFDFNRAASLTVRFDIDAQGRVLAVQPFNVTESVDTPRQRQVAEAAIRRAAPFGPPKAAADPSRTVARTRIEETWVFDSAGRFGLRTVIEGGLPQKDNQTP